MIKGLIRGVKVEDNESSLCRQRDTDNRGKGDDKICTREFGGEDGKQMYTYHGNW